MRQCTSPVLAFAALVAVLALLGGCTRVAAREAGPAATSLPGGAHPPPGVLIAHALGAVEGVVYTNSAEALETSLAAGRRWLEVDLALSSDGHLVCFHRGYEGAVGIERDIGETTAAEFLATRFHERFTTLSFADLLDRLAGVPDAVVVTDTKWWTEPIGFAFYAAVSAVPQGRRPRIVPQIYQPGDLDIIRRLEEHLGPFPSVILTLYRTNMADADVAAFAVANRIGAVTASKARFGPGLVEALRPSGIPLLVHTFNEHDEIVHFAARGAQGFYTDWYRPFSDFFDACGGHDTPPERVPRRLLPGSRDRR